MAQPKDTASWDLSPWAGTLDQLIRAAKLCAARVADAAPSPAGYDPEDREKPYDVKEHQAWLAARGAREVEIGVVEDGGFARTLTELDDLADIPPDHLDRLGVIDIKIGGNGFVSPSATIGVSRRNGLEVRICGADRTWTAGLRHEVQDVLKPLERLRPPGMKADVPFLVVGGVLAVFVGGGLSLLFSYATDWARGVEFGAAVAPAYAVGGLIAFLVLKLPTMEVLAPGGHPKYQRWKSRILAAAGALVIGILGSIIASAVWD